MVKSCSDEMMEHINETELVMKSGFMSNRDDFNNIQKEEKQTVRK